MLIMAPFADLFAFERQIAVLAFQYGVGIITSIIPASGMLMEALAIAGIPYGRWIGFVWKLIAGCLFIAATAIIIALMIGIK